MPAAEGPIRHSRSRRRHRRDAVRRVCRTRLYVEPLEDRRLLAVFTWDGGGGDLFWNNPLNWDADALPGIGDDVVVGDLPGEVTISHASSGATEIASLTSAESIEISSGQLILTADSQIDADLTVESNAQLLIETAALTGNGRLATRAGGQATLIDAALGVDVDNQGSILVLGFDNLISGALTNAVDAILSIEGNELGGSLLTVSDGFVNDGFVDLAGNFYPDSVLALSVVNGPLVNRGAITAFGDSTGDTHVLDFDLVNEGFLDVYGDTSLTGQLTTTPASEIIVVGTDVSGGTNLTFDQAFTNLGFLELVDNATSGPAAATVNLASGGTLTNGPTGLIRSSAGTSGGSRQINSPVANQGDIEVLATLDVDQLQQTAGRIELFDAALIAQASIVLNGGSLEGNGDVSGLVTSSGTVSPGASPGAIQFETGYSQLPAGRLLVELAGNSPAEYDRVLGFGTVQLDGRLDVELIDAFVPSVGDQFVVVFGEILNGDFSQVNLPNLGAGKQWQAGKSGSSYVLEVVASGPANTPPVAAGDSYNLPQDGQLIVPVAQGVLANDSDDDDDPLTAVLVTGPQNGQLDFYSDGSFSYLPDRLYSGPDSFTYRADDGTDQSATATVTIDVVAETNPPVATLVGEGGPSAGSTGFQLQVIYDDFSGVELDTIDDFDVRVTGPNGFSQLATLVQVAPPGGSGGQTGPMTATVYYNIAAPGGTWDAADNGDYLISLEPGQVGDIKGNLAPGKPLGTFTLDIVPPPQLLISDATVFEGDAGQTLATFFVSLVGTASSAVTVDYATVNDSAVSGNDFEATSGQLTFEPGTTELPVDVFVQGDEVAEALRKSFRVVLSDPVGAELVDSQGLGIILDDEIDASEDAPPRVIPLADLFNGSFSQVAVLDNSNPNLFSGVDLDQNAGTLTLRFAPNAFGTAELMLRANPMAGPAVDRALSIRVAGVNDAPTTSELSDVLVGPGVEDAVVDLWAAFADVEDAAAELTFTTTANTSDPLYDDVIIDDQTGELVLRFAEGQAGDRTIRVTATDTGGESVFAEFALQVRRLGSIVEGNVVLDEDQGASIPLASPFIGFPASFSVLGNSNPALVTGATVNASTGQLQLSLAPDAAGEALLSVQAIGPEQGQSFTQQVKVIVRPVNDPPTTGGLANVVVDQRTVQSVIPLAGAFFDVDDSTQSLVFTTDATASAEGLFQSAQIDTATGALTLVYRGRHGQQQVGVTATDPLGLSVTTQFLVTVTPAAVVIDSVSLSEADDNAVGIANDGQTNNPLPTIEVTVDGTGPVTVTLDSDNDGQFDDAAANVTLPEGLIGKSVVPLALAELLEDGLHDLHVRTADSFNHVATQTTQVRVDRTPPRVTMALPHVIPRPLVIEPSPTETLAFTLQLSEVIPYTTGVTDPAKYRLRSVSTGEDVSRFLQGITATIRNAEAPPGNGPHANTVEIRFQPDTNDLYELTFLGSQVTDAAGNTFEEGDTQVQAQFSSSPPQVLGVRAVTSFGSSLPRQVAIKLSDFDLQIPLAENPANYLLQKVDAAGNVTSTIPVNQAIYNPWSDEVLLYGLPPLSAGRYRLTMIAEQNSLGATGLRTLTRVWLDGDGDGSPGGNYVAQFQVAPPSQSLPLDNQLMSGIFAGLDGELKYEISLKQLASRSLAREQFADRLLKEVQLVVRTHAGDTSQQLVSAVNNRIEQVFQAALEAELARAGIQPGEFVIAWGNRVRFLVTGAGGGPSIGYQADGTRVAQIDDAVLADDGTGPGGMAVAIIPVRALSKLNSNSELIERADGQPVKPDLTYYAELQGTAEQNQAGLVYFGSDGEVGQIRLTDIATESGQWQWDLSRVLSGFDPLLNNFTQDLVKHMAAAMQGHLDQYLILALDPVDFVLQDTQGNTSRHVGATNSDGFAGVWYGGNSLTELLVIPNAAADLYTLSLVGVGEGFRGAAVFVQGNDLQVVPLQGLLGSSDNLVATIDFRNSPSPVPVAPPVSTVAQSGGVFSVSDSGQTGSTATTGGAGGSDGGSGGQSSSTTLSSRVRGGGHKKSGTGGWMDWVFEKIEGAQEKASDLLDEDGEGNEEHNKNEDENPEDDSPLGAVPAETTDAPVTPTGYRPEDDPNPPVTQASQQATPADPMGASRSGWAALWFGQPGEQSATHSEVASPQGEDASRGASSPHATEATSEDRSGHEQASDQVFDEVGLLGLSVGVSLSLSRAADERRRVRVRRPASLD